MNPAIQEGFSTAALEMISGATGRQLQWWDEKGVIRARRQRPGYHASRDYSLEQALLVMVTAHLRRCGLSLQRVKKLAQDLSRDARLHKFIESKNGTELFLLIGTKHQRFAYSETAVIRDMVCRPEPFLLLALHEFVATLKQCKNPRATRVSLQ